MSDAEKIVAEWCGYDFDVRGDEGIIIGRGRDVLTITVGVHLPNRLDHALPDIGDARSMLCVLIASRLSPETTRKLELADAVINHVKSGGSCPDRPDGGRFMCSWDYLRHLVAEAGGE